MKKKLSTFLTVILTAMLMTSTVSAGGVKISANWGLSSLLANVTATGLGSSDYVFVLTATGFASATCTNQGGNAAPGQNYPHVDAVGQTLVPDGDTPVTKNGKAVFPIEAIPDEEIVQQIPWDVAGCPNSNWTAVVDFVYWQFATITAYNISSGAIAAQYNYQCTTTRTGPNNTPSTFDDGTVSCTSIN